MVGAGRQARSNLRKELMTAHTVARLVIERPMEFFFLAAHDGVHSRDATGGYAVPFVALATLSLGMLAVSPLFRPPRHGSPP